MRTSGAETAALGLVQRYLFRDQLVTPESSGRDPALLRCAVARVDQLLQPWNWKPLLQYNPDRRRVVRSILGARIRPGRSAPCGLTYR